MSLPAAPAPSRAFPVRADVALGAALLVWLVIVVVKQYEPDTYLMRDGAFYATMSRSLATGLTLDQTDYQPRSWYTGELPYYRDVDQAWSNLSLGRDGRHWPKHSYLMPVVATPFYLALGKPGLLVFNVLQCLVLLLLAFKIAEHFSGTVPAAVAVALLATSPIVVETAYRFNHDLFSAMLVAAFMLAMLRRRMTLAGALFGIALWAKLTSIAVVGPFALAFLLTRPYPRDEWLPFAIAAAVPLAMWGACNWYMFGSPTLTSYDRILIVVNGVPQTESVRVAFDQPLDTGARALLGEGEGLGAMMPLAYVGAVGVLLLARRAPLVTIASLLALVAYPLEFGPYRWPHTRFFFPWLPVAALGLAALLAWAGASKPWRSVLRATERLPRWAPAAAIGGIFVLSVVAILVHRDPPRLSGRIPSAEVFLGDVPCDYFNPQHDKWECSRIDQQPWELTGAAEAGQCDFDGAPGPLVWAHPQRTGQPRRLLWHGIPRTSHADFLVGIDAASQPAPANVELWIDDRLFRSFTPDAPGRLERVTLPASALSRRANDVEIRVGPPADGRDVCFDLRW